MMQQNTDTVPAMLTPGEFVIRKDAAEQIGPEKLEMLNNVDRLGEAALIENARSPMGYQEGGVISGMTGDTAEKYSDLKSLFGGKHSSGAVRFSDLSDADFDTTTDQLFDFIKGRRKVKQFMSDNPELQGPSGLEMRRQDEKTLLEKSLAQATPKYTETEQSYLSSLPALNKIAKKYEMLSASPQQDLSVRRDESPLGELGPEGVMTQRYQDYLSSTPQQDLGFRGEQSPLKSDYLKMVDPGRPDTSSSTSYQDMPDELSGLALEKLAGTQGDFAPFGKPASEPEVYFGDLPMWEKLGMIMMGEKKFDKLRNKSRQIMSGDEFQGGEVTGVPQDANFLKAILGMHEGGEVMHNQNDEQMGDVLSMFGEKSQDADGLQKLAAMAAMQQMQQPQQFQQGPSQGSEVGAFGALQKGGYVKEYQQGGPVQPPMSEGEEGPQEVPMSGGQQAYHKTPMSQLGLDEHEYKAYIRHGPDLFRWFPQKYKPKTEWTVYDSLVDAGTVDPYKVDKDSINVLTDDQLNELIDKSGIRQ